MTADPRAIHARAITSLCSDISAFNNLITLYARSGDLSAASAVFRRLIPRPNVVSWTALISGHGTSAAAFCHFRSMLRHPVLPNERTLASLLKTCAALLPSSLPFALQLHCLALKLSLSSHPFAASALAHFYSKSRLPQHARRVFNEIPHRDAVVYSSIIVGLAQNSASSDALSVFARMRADPSSVASTIQSVAGALHAAAELASFEKCRMIHAHAVAAGLDSNVIVGTALIDGYGKCGVIEEARRVFHEMSGYANVFGWNALMAGYAQLGDKDAVLQLFGSMERQGLVPDDYSFLAILTSLCNAGLVAEVQEWVARMKSDYGIEPAIQHYTCLVGALGRAGQLEDAEKIALTMPFQPDAAVWRVLLSSAAHHGKADMAWAMAKRLLELNERDDSAYWIVANAFSAACRLDEVSEVRKLMRENQVRKQAGRSWVEVRGIVHMFFAGDRQHERTLDIYTKLEELKVEASKLGYVPVWDGMLQDVDDKEKGDSLWYHSEKLALAFMLVSSGAVPPGKPLRIVKNLKICKDCHEAFKYIGRVVEREIIVRDANRYHRFLDGSCSCGDFW